MFLKAPFEAKWPRREQAKYPDITLSGNYFNLSSIPKYLTKVLSNKGRRQVDAITSTENSHSQPLQTAYLLMLILFLHL